LTALAVLILAVAVVAVRAGSSDTVEAATGTIDVLNVGTCYTTSTDVFAVGECDSGERNAEDEPVAYDVAGRDTITETGMVYATYAHDPKTAPDSPRAVLVNSNLLKISITDPGRDKRTPVLLGAGDNTPCRAVSETPGDPCLDNGDYYRVDNPDTATDESGHLAIIRKDYSGIKADDEPDFRWNVRDATAADAAFNVLASAEQKDITGIRIFKHTATTDPYKPMFVTQGDDSPINLYGTFDSDSDPSTTVQGDGFQKLNKYLNIDEDVGSGRVVNESGDNEEEVAPWFSVKLAIPTGATVDVMYVVYQTSEFESLRGGSSVDEENGKAAVEDAEGTVTTAAVPGMDDAPAFTKTELRSGTTKLVVEARSDGRTRSQNLVLRETSRFSGQYEGYLKLTDENGNNGTGAPNNWGMPTSDGDSCTDADLTTEPDDYMVRTGCSADRAAVLGVESGPVVIAYKDTDGTTQLKDIAIDTVPPSVVVDQPEHEVQIQDLSPEFSGSFADAGSGLRKGSFRAYVDHTDDAGENGVMGKAVLDLRVDASGGAYGFVDIIDDKDAVESEADYIGYSPDEKPVFGVIPHGDVFNLDTTAADTMDKVESIDGDPHDDGSINGTFGDSVRIDFLEDEDYNNTIDFQALVADIAGNIGFSDSDDDGPRFINNYGETVESKKRKTERYNVLGWYARHVFFLDEVDPVIFQEQSVTGFYGENDDDVPQVNRAGILIAFDRAVDEDSIDRETFTVTLDPTGGAGSTGEAAQIIDVDPEGRAVYLLLSEELASDATPKVDIASNKWVSDPAGNRLTGGNQPAFDVKDGIAPKITVSLDGGSGSGEGDEGPSKLTKDSIIVTIAADEDINSTPSLVVVCSNIGWGRERGPDPAAEPLTENDKALEDLVKSRSSGGRDKNTSVAFSDPLEYDCGTDENSYEVTLQDAQSYSRPGLAWEYQWVNFSDPKDLKDGKLTVVAYARDRSSFASLTNRKIDDTPTSANRYNWGASTVEFRFDTTLNNPTPTPADEAVVTEQRPFVMLAYDDKSTVSIEEFKIDGTVQEARALGDNRFLYWPDTLELGTHEVSVKAIDAAGKEDTFEFSFKTAERKDFGLKLIAGWNAISFPANPMDPMIENVFTDALVDMVAGWDAGDPEKPWSIATRMGDEWSTNEEHATLSKVHAQYGYWVHSQGFTTQRVKLIPDLDRTDPSAVPANLVTIPTLPGWNFVGVIDQDGNQTQDNYGEYLMNRDADGNDVVVKAGDYLGDNKRAYTWDPIRAKFDIIEDGDELQIGEGIWVYFGGGIAP
jgi:hypothetical protein